MKTVLAIFNNREDANQAIDELDDKGYRSKDISVIMQGHDHHNVVERGNERKTGNKATSSEATGAVIGGLAGLLVGLGIIAVPGIGGLFIGGPIAAALGLSGVAATATSGAITGALAGGLLGSLVGIGVPEEDAKVYEDRIKHGGILVAVPVASHADDDDEVRDILDEYDATDIKTVTLRT